MRSILIFLLLVISGSSVMAQKDILDRIAPESGKIIEKAAKLLNEKKYDLAAKEFLKIPENDTSYITGQYEAALAYLSDSSYDKSLEIALKLKDVISNKRHLVYSLIGSNYKEKKEYDKALAVLKEGTEIAPAYYLFHLEMGMVYEKMERWQDAFEAYQKAVYYSPLNVSSNVRLGLLCARAGMVTEAMMSLHMALLSDPSGGENMLGLIENVSSGDFKVDIQLKHKYPMTQFDDIKLILVNKVALSKSYKINSKIDYKVVRQTQALFEKLSYEKNNLNFFNQQYSRLFQTIFTQNLYNGYSSYVFSEVSRPDLAKEVKKYQADAAKFRTWLINNLERNFAEQMLAVDGGKELLYHEYNNNFRLIAYGKTNAEKKPNGIWNIYHNNGFLYVKGNIVNDLKEGLWVYHHDNGRIKDSTTWKNNLKNGVSTLYNENGYITQKITYANDVLEGPVYNYYPSGVIESIIPFKKDERNGTMKTFYQNGSLEKEMNYVNGKLEGSYFDYFANQQLYEKSTYKAGKINGSSTIYYSTGAVRIEKQFTDGNASGKWIYYFSNGKVEQTGNYANNSQVGKWEEFNSDGVLIEEMLLDENGKLNGVVKKYSSTGKLISEQNYSKGDLQAYKCFNEAGRLLKEAKKEKGVIHLCSYTEQGQMLQEGDLLNGERDGIWKFYFPNGKLKATETYVKGSLEGPFKNYHRNGKISSEGVCKDGEKEGLEKTYHLNGTLSGLGFYKEGKLNGFEEEYNQFGVLVSSIYWLDGNQDGTATYYHPNGKIQSIDYFKEDLFIGRKEFDTNGVVINDVKFNFPKDTLIGKHVNGKTDKMIPYVGGAKQGLVKWIHGNGQTEVEANYVNNVRHGEYKNYTSGGVLRNKFNYLLGSRHGTVERYFNEGMILEKGECVLDAEQGIWNEYHKNGKLAVERNYKDGELHGKSTYFTPDGDICRIFYFENNVLKFYSYIGKDGKEVPKIPVLSRGTFTITTFFQNGNKAWEIPLLDGYWEGKATAWYADGKVWKTIDYLSDEENGKFIVYHKNGKVASDENYVMGNSHGYSVYYDENGKMEREYNHYDDLIHGDCTILRNNKPVKIKYFYGEIFKEQ